MRRILMLIVVLAAVAATPMPASASDGTIPASAANHCPESGKFSSLLSAQPRNGRAVITSTLNYSFKGCADSDPGIMHGGTIRCVRRNNSVFTRTLTDIKKVSVGSGTSVLTASYRLRRIKSCTAEFGYAIGIGNRLASDNRQATVRSGH